MARFTHRTERDHLSIRDTEKGHTFFGKRLIIGRSEFERSVRISLGRDFTFVVGVRNS